MAMLKACIIPFSSFSSMSIVFRQKTWSIGVAEDLEAMYAVQDMCWEDFALANGLVVKRSPEVQQTRGKQKGFGMFWGMPIMSIKRNDASRHLLKR